MKGHRLVHLACCPAWSKSQFPLTKISHPFLRGTTALIFGNRRLIEMYFRSQPLFLNKNLGKIAFFKRMNLFLPGRYFFLPLPNYSPPKTLS